jgi:diguanylate cyclase (GGDEF)-like protein
VTAYADQLRRTNERLAIGIAGAFALMTFLPITSSNDRLGVLATAVGFVVLIALWFHVVPTRAFAEHRVFIFTVLVLPIVVMLLVLSGGISSVYFPYLLLPVVITVYSARRWHTPVAAALTVVSILVIAALTGAGYSESTHVNWIGNNIVATLVFAAFTWVIARALRTARSDQSHRASELARAELDARRLALTDSLTGLFNRHHGNAMLDQLVAGAGRGQRFSVLAMDVNDMKGINDTRGHASGDATLVGLAQLLRKELRGMDVPIRTGGDEFVVLLPATNEEQATRVVERLDEGIAEDNERSPARAFTVSIGLAEWRRGMTAIDLLAAADAAMYAIKRARPA